MADHCCPVYDGKFDMDGRPIAGRVHESKQINPENHLANVPVEHVCKYRGNFCDCTHSVCHERLKLLTDCGRFTITLRDREFQLALPLCLRLVEHRSQRCFNPWNCAASYSRTGSWCLHYASTQQKTATSQIGHSLISAASSSEAQTWPLLKQQQWLQMVESHQKILGSGRTAKSHRSKRLWTLPMARVRILRCSCAMQEEREALSLLGSTVRLELPQTWEPEFFNGYQRGEWLTSS